MTSHTLRLANLRAKQPVRRALLWASLSTGLAVLAYVGGAAYLFNTAPGDREARPTLQELRGIETRQANTAKHEEAYFLDHSVVNRQNLPTEPNPAPKAIAAYE
jgi:hypothetical protein